MVHDAQRGKAAVTAWRRLAVIEGRALVLMTPETGRTHQLRVHAAEGLGLAIAGDPVYGDGRGPMLLHARSLAMAREGKEPVEAVAPLPPTFLQAGFGDDLL
jgi:tRNA pseudouridine32 synthase/23S rRNA pseudouridine746 synthase